MHYWTFSSKSQEVFNTDYVSPDLLKEEEQLLEEVEQAAADGDTKTLEGALFRLATSAFCEPPGNALFLAIENGHFETTEYLLQHGVHMTTNAVTIAVERRDMKMLDLLLRNGWDVNMQLEITTPSALRELYCLE